MKNTGKPESGGSSLSGNERGASEEVVEEMCLDLPTREASSIPPVRPPKKTSYSLELFRTRRNIRWFQIPLSSLRKPKAGLFSFTFQSSLQEYQQLRKAKRLKVGQPFSILPLPRLPALLTDSSQRASHKRRDNRRPSGAGEAKGSKRLSSHREEPQTFSQRMHKRHRTCSSSARSSQRRVSHPKTLGQLQGEEPGSSCSKKQEQVDPGRFEQDLHFDAPGPSRSSSCSSWPLAEAAGGDSGFGRWVGASSPLEEEDYEFPPDWSPPRIEFLYDRGPPPLSPAPGPDPESPSSREMAEVSTWPAEPPVLELTAEAFSPAGGGHVHSWGGPFIQPRKECESRGRASLEHPVSVFCQAVNEEREGATLGNEIQMEDGKAFGVGEHPPLLSPIHPRAASSPVCLRSGLSTVSVEFSRDLESPNSESEEEGDQGPESPASSIPTHLLIASSRTSSRCSLSASSNELSEGPEGLTQDAAMEEGPDDSGLLPLKQLLQMSSMDLGAVEPHTRFLPSRSDGYLRSLDQLLEERRKQTWEDEQLERNLGEKLSLLSPLSSGEVPGQGEAPLPEAHRLILEQFSIPRDTIPAVHPGENIFGPPGYDPRTPVALDASGLKPRNQLEHLFFSSQFARQVKLLQDGFLRTLYCGSFCCPRPVLSWLFQLMSLSPDISADAFQALWEISVHQLTSADKSNTDFWCPDLKDIIQAFYHFGACSSTLFPAGLVQPEFRSEELEFQEHPFRSAGIDQEGPLQNTPCRLILAVMLRRIFKFLTLCLIAHPPCYPDQQRLALAALLCRISLDRKLRKQPQVECQLLLVILIEGIQDWQEKLPGFCRSLCHVSQHHHNLVAVVRSFPDTTARGRQLRKNLSLCFIAKLLGKTQMAARRWQEETQLQQLSCLLPLMKPNSLKRFLLCEWGLQKPPGENHQEAPPTEPDLEACYLCYSLLLLANVVVGTKALPSREHGCLRQLCAQLQQHIGANLREDPCLMYRTRLKDLVARTYIKWLELPSQG
nr:protein FAM178B [Pogona vitticeps]XP_020635881.1 protein FAM178B [Pogona vitticeps]XP_020635882.1 protein FAM178B [Pogona vitticeps]